MNLKARHRVCQMCPDFAAGAAWSSCQDCAAYLPEHTGGPCPKCDSPNVKAWPRCYHSRPMTDSPSDVLQLTPEIIAGPDDSCAAGRWTDATGWAFPARKMTCALCEDTRGRGPYEPSLCVATGAVVNRTAAFMTGADRNCPRSRWNRVKETPFETSAAEASAAALEKETKRAERLLGPFLDELTPEALAATLIKLVGTGRLSPDAASWIGEQRDVPPLEPVPE